MLNETELIGRLVKIQNAIGVITNCVWSDAIDDYSIKIRLAYGAELSTTGTIIYRFLI
jgi:hypothetical protein